MLFKWKIKCPYNYYNNGGVYKCSKNDSTACELNNDHNGKEQPIYDFGNWINRVNDLILVNKSNYNSIERKNNTQEV